MAGSVNKVILVGHLGSDPEVRYTQGGAAVASFTVATNESYTDKSGQRQDKTEWHRIVAWGKTAELCGEYLQKGRQVYLEGRLQTRQWDDKEGVKRYTTEIVAQTVQFLGSRNERGDGPGVPREGGDAAPRESNYRSNTAVPAQAVPHQGSAPAFSQNAAPRAAAPAGGGYRAAPQQPAHQEKSFDYGPPPMSDDDIPF